MSALNHTKARYAALTRSRPDDDPVLIEAKRDLAEARIASYIDKILSKAPPLNDEQRQRISELLRGPHVSEAGRDRAAADAGGGDTGFGSL